MSINPNKAKCILVLGRVSACTRVICKHFRHGGHGKVGILTFVFAKSLYKCKEAPKSNGYIYRVVGCVSEGRRFQSHSGLDWTTLTVHPAMNGYLAFVGES